MPEASQNNHKANDVPTTMGSPRQQQQQQQQQRRRRKRTSGSRRSLPPSRTITTTTASPTLLPPPPPPLPTTTPRSWKERMLRSSSSVEDEADEWARRLQHASDVLLETLFRHLSKLPEEGGGGESSDASHGTPQQQQQQRHQATANSAAARVGGMTLPAIAVAWLGGQLLRLKEDDGAFEENLRDSSVPLWMGPSLRDRLSLLRFLLPRVTHLRLTRDSVWPPKLPSKSSQATPPTPSPQQQRRRRNPQTRGGPPPPPPLEELNCSTISVSSALTIDTLHSPPTRRAFLRYVSQLQNNPCIDLRVFPNLKVLVLEGVPPSWITHLYSLQDSLQVLRMTKACLYRLPSLLFPPLPPPTTPKPLAQPKPSHNSPPQRTQKPDPLAAPPPPTTTQNISYPFLTHLKLEYCKIGEMSGIKCLRRLEHVQSLSLAHNQICTEITALQGLRYLSRLTKLDLSYNSLSSLATAYQHLGKLQVLRLSYNQITSAKGLDRLYGLEELWLDHNQFCRTSDVAGLARLPLLRKLYLQGNPLKNSYRAEVLRCFAQNHRSPQELPVLDGMPLTSDEWKSIKSESFVDQSVVIPSFGTAAADGTTLNGDGESQETTAPPLIMVVPTRNPRVQRKRKSNKAKIYPLSNTAVVSSSFPTAFDMKSASASSSSSSKSRKLATAATAKKESSASIQVQQKAPRETNDTKRAVAFSVRDVLLSIQQTSEEDEEDEEESADDAQTKLLQIEDPQEDSLPTAVEPVDSTALEKTDEGEALDAIADEDGTESQPHASSLLGGSDIPRGKEAREVRNTFQGEAEQDDMVQKDSLKDISDSQQHDVSTASCGGSDTQQLGKESQNNDSEDKDAGIIVQEQADKDAVVEPANCEELVSQNLEQDQSLNPSKDKEHEEESPTKELKKNKRKKKTVKPPAEMGEVVGTLNLDLGVITEKRKVATVKLQSGATSQFDVFSADWDDLVRMAAEGLIPNGQHRKEKSGVFSMATANLLSPTSKSDTQIEVSTKESSIAAGNSHEDSVASGLGSGEIAIRSSLPTTPPTHSLLLRDDLSVPSSLGTNREDFPASNNFQLAEDNSKFDGPDACANMKVVKNFELYFNTFVFPMSVSQVPASPTGDVAEKENEWQNVLIRYPRIQLWPEDRRWLETNAEGKDDWESDRERLVRVWEEDVIPCGKPALRRLAPNRRARLGFHGDRLFENGNTDPYTECRKVYLCLSSSAFYVILREDAVTLFNKKQNGKKKKFPVPIGKDLSFKDAPWPHAVARHSFEDLQAVSIGLEFQRLTLRFSNPSIRNSDPFVYVLLTSNKQETVGLLQDIQRLAKEANEHVTDLTSDTAAVAIENDSQVVFDSFAAAVAPDLVGTILHYQIVQQRWKHGERGTVRRVCLVTDTKVFLLDEDYAADGHQPLESSLSGVKMADTKYRIVDEASLKQVSEVQAAGEDPKAITIVINPIARLSRTHRWRLVCRDSAGAERLVEDVRKALTLADN